MQVYCLLLYSTLYHYTFKGGGSSILYLSVCVYKKMDKPRFRGGVKTDLTHEVLSALKYVNIILNSLRHLQIFITVDIKKILTLTSY